MTLTSNPSPTPGSPRPWTEVRGHAPGLEGVPCRVEVRIAGEPAGVLRVEENGDVSVVDKGRTAALLSLDTRETLMELLRGDLPPIVAHLQGRLRFEGDGDLALRVLFGLQQGSPWASAEPRSFGDRP